MKTTYKHPFYVHLFVPGVICAFAWMAWHFSSEPIVNEGPLDRFWVVSVGVVPGLVVLALYLTSALNRYEVTDEGLRIRGFRRDTFHPWSEITRLDHNRPLHCVFIRGRNGRIAYSSTDMFPDLADLLYAIYDRSHCSLPPHLAAALGVSVDEPS